MNDEKIPNALISETSPYLLQHAYNPVHWFSWNEETLNRARIENKMLIVSIGYAACHWCHVMERECFEDTEVAKVMNENFLCIKVDREERPDVDDVYMTACQLVNQRGCGWPLNAFAMPDGSPVWATTYHPKAQWIHLLNQINTTYQQQPERLIKAANDLTNGIKNHDRIFNSNFENVDQHLIHNIMMDFMSVMDFENGGRKGAPKFPMPNTLECLMKYYVFSKEERIFSIVELTLDKMAMGGIYDQLYGGWARYSVDDIWMVPHFEKMLYDNAQLIYVYSMAYQKNKKHLYQKAVTETIEFMKKDWLHENGGFYSAYDADSEGVEGKYYTWTYEEIKEQIKDPIHLQLFSAYFSIETEGNFEETNVLHRTEENALTQKFGISIGELNSIIDHYKNILLAIRNTRTKPLLDHKILTSWNALAAKGLMQAYQTFGNEEYLNLAKSCLHYLTAHCMDDEGKLLRTNANSPNVINGFLEDYATTIDALIKMYEMTFDEENLFLAKKLNEYVLKYFETTDGIMFHYTSILEPSLAVRKIETSDNVISSSNSIMARCLYKLGYLLSNEEYTARAEKMVGSMMDYISKIRAPHFYANWCSAFIEQRCNQGELVITGKHSLLINAEMQNKFYLNLLTAGSHTSSQLKLMDDKQNGDKTLFYLCENGICHLPTDDGHQIEVYLNNY